MRVAILSYPMLFQTSGGIKMKIGRTIDALAKRGVEARLIDPVREKLTDYDLVHVFASHQGNFRIVEHAKAAGLPVVVSSILNPPYSKWDGLKARLLSRLVGRLTKWEIHTTYQQIHACLDKADHVVVLGKAEEEMVREAYKIDPAKVSIVRNGVGEEFFDTPPDAFRQAYAIPEPFVLHTGLLGDVKNQLGLIRALKGEKVPILMLGYSDDSTRPYLEECLREGGEYVHYLGELPHGPLLASAYAACSVVAIPSRHEGMPNSILEGLASDKPVVMTTNHTMDMDLPEECVRQVDSYDPAAIRKNVLDLLANPPARGRCRQVVESLSWPKVAEQLHGIYQSLLQALPKRQPD